MLIFGNERRFYITRRLINEKASLEQRSGTVDTIEICFEKFLVQTIEMEKANDQRHAPRGCSDIGQNQ